MFVPQRQKTPSQVDMITLRDPYIVHLGLDHGLKFLVLVSSTMVYGSWSWAFALVYITAHNPMVYTQLCGDQMSHNPMVYKQLYADQTAALDVSNVDDNIYVWCPYLELSLPRHQSWQRYDKQEWTIDVISIHQHWQECNDLNSLAEPHLICQYHSILSVQPAVTSLHSHVTNVDSMNRIYYTDTHCFNTGCVQITESGFLRLSRTFLCAFSRTF